MTVKLETNTIRTIAAFEKLTKVHAKDCLITDDCIYFLVNQNKIGLAIGKNGSVAKEVRRILGKPIKIFAYSSDPKELIKNMIPNIKNLQINNESMMLTIPPDEKITVIGKNGRNIKIIKSIMDRHFGIKNLKIR
ncbi:MAG: NusA-like transcription termination signal-binding factor [Nanoarchaeota archaeon]|nr:NusA-like transcription termination signal-binding factor [Nanoarchaeota archaeon]MBU1135254.1 NusA-like transcription termination signal-binding factor [Nanoarchaeota archaeon]MBU2519896.1 NusA-like transcription termination signal-binding factor [Nanoarchaeota archaeon]